LIEVSDDLVDKIVELSPSSRDNLLTVDDGHGIKRLYIYNDGEKKYAPIDERRIVLQTGEVSNVESFLALVREETLRRGAAVTDSAPDNPKSTTTRKPAAKADRSETLAVVRHDGSFMTVVFNAKVAKFAPDDRVRLDSFGYERALSPQWNALVGALGKPMEHKDLIRVLQRLRPSIKRYEDLMRDLRKITFSDRTNITSEPLLQAGKNQNEYKVDLEVRAGTDSLSQTTALPSSFDVELQYARGGDKRYATTIEIDLSTFIKGERKELRFTLIAPDLPNVEEAAIDDEVAFFRAETADIPRLLILQDY